LKSAYKQTLLALLLTVFLFQPSAGYSTELSIPPMEAKSGDMIDIPVIIDRVDNLAGIKVVLNYDPNILIYKKASKTEQTASLMHIVNDKRPGLLIAVMAGAKGIKGSSIPLLMFTFEVKETPDNPVSTRLDITDVELMSDQLEDIKCGIVTSPLSIGAADIEPEDQTEGEQSKKGPAIAEKAGRSAKEKTGEVDDESRLSLPREQ